MDWPIIKVFIGSGTKQPDCKFFWEGKHPCIPSVGDHICVEYKEHKVWRTEHILSSFCDVKAHVFLQEVES
jgi:hypothetical protein